MRADCSFLDDNAGGSIRLKVPTTSCLLPILRRLRPSFQRFAVPDGAFAGVVGQLEILGQFQRVGRTGVLAQPAKHAAAQIVSKVGKFFAAGFLIVITRYDYSLV